ncbi:uncharacterized protein N7500_008683 [Penicillium coprophilum]|uniref:uncharacterized protein n=1 Tax=Penicillium coprophilum TaxID=36646 RepID=UPI0023998229|nr:uncharacterized protein N7500_008683 [Penicillium coprophilum]KAJ5159032.1 hypothetical protein N7500_008683 [Penicillium coprophilum]
MARQGLYRDNQANLYALAVLAYQSGHSKFLLADELTKRPLIGKPHAGEGSALSVILISVNEKPAIPEGISVWARRETALSQMKQGPNMMAVSSRDKYGKSEDLRFMTLIAQFFD